MKKYYFIFPLFVLLATISCTSQKELYSWGDYDQRSYNYVKNDTEENLDLLLASYQKMVDKQTGLRQTPPPGVCADYGFLLIKKGKNAEAILMLRKEMALYPESSTFISRIIKKLEQ